MGGIPWQSKGCRTCKRRKIKCDTQRPECGQCLKRGVNCGKYEGTRMFIHEAPRTRRDPGAKAQAQNSREAQAQLVDRTGLQSLTCGPAMREQVFSSYMNFYFPAQAFSSVDLWYYLISNISSLPQKSIMLQNAISAVACIYCGKFNHDKRVFQQGIQLYNSAIRHVSNMITRSAYCDDILYATIIFQEIETCYCPHDLQTWMAHIAGTNAILSHYSDRAERGPLVNAIYQEYRKLRTVIVAFQISLGGSIDISQLFSTRSSILFEAFEYTIRPCESNPIVELLSIFAEFAPLAAAIDRVDPPNLNACQVLLHKCLAHKEKLMVWFRENIQGVALPCSSEVVRSSVPLTDHLFGTPYCFPSLDVARLHIMFWTLSSIVHPLISRIRTLSKVCDSHESFGAGPGSNMYEDEDVFLSGFYADQVGRSIPYLVQDSMKSWGVHTAVFSLCQLCKITVDRGNKEQFDWCQHVFDLMAERGFDAATRHSEMFRAMWSAKSNIARVVMPVPLQLIK